MGDCLSEPVNWRSDPVHITRDEHRDHGRAEADWFTGAVYVDTVA